MSLPNVMHMVGTACFVTHCFDDKPTPNDDAAAIIIGGVVLLVAVLFVTFFIARWMTR